jgi:predicted nucleotidyltransferase
VTSLPAVVGDVLATYLERLRRVLGESLVGVYVTGSAATGDFEPAGSDIDVFVVLNEAPGSDVFEGLRHLHDEMRAAEPFGDRLEVEYVAANQLRPTGISGEAASISAGGELRIGRSRAAADDILGARSLGIPLFGPSAKDVFPQVGRDVFVASQREWLADLAECDRSRPNASGADYTTWTLNIARCLFGIHHGHGCTKPEAARWLARQMPELARTLEAALSARAGDAAVTIDRGRFQRFVNEARTITSRTET